MTESIEKDEFCRRFVAEMMTYLPRYAGAEAELRSYAEGVAGTYWDDEEQREEGPEECARTDYSYWEE